MKQVIHYEILSRETVNSEMCYENKFKSDYRI